MLDCRIRLSMEREGNSLTKMLLIKKRWKCLERHREEQRE